MGQDRLDIMSRVSVQGATEIYRPAIHTREFSSIGRGLAAMLHASTESAKCFFSFARDTHSPGSSEEQPSRVEAAATVSTVDMDADADSS